MYHAQINFTNLDGGDPASISVKSGAGQIMVAFYTTLEITVSIETADAFAVVLQEAVAKSALPPAPPGRRVAQIINFTTLNDKRDASINIRSSAGEIALLLVLYGAGDLELSMTMADSRNVVSMLQNASIHARQERSVTKVHNAPRILTHLFLIPMLFLFGVTGCGALSSAEDAPPPAPTILQLDVSPPLYTSLYFRPPTDTIVSDATIAEYELRVVHSQEEAARFTERIDVIYIHASMLPALEKNWLRDEFYAGATVVGLNIPINTLGEFLGINPGMADLREIEDFFYISMFHHTYDSAGNTSGRGVHSEYYPGFEDIPHGVNTIMWLNGSGQ